MEDGTIPLLYLFIPWLMLYRNGVPTNYKTAVLITLKLGRETMYKLLSFLFNSDTFISTCIWLVELLLSYIFI